MGYDDLSLSLFQVDCDGSSCGSGNVGRHFHPRQDGGVPLARCVVRDGKRVGYEAMR